MTVSLQNIGRVVREVRPTSDVTYTYDGASPRVLSATDSMSGETVTRLYNDLGEAVGQVKNGVTNRTDTAYEVSSNVLWRVTTQITAGGTRSVASVTQERLTGLSDELRSETFEYRNGALALHTHSSFDPTNAILTEVSESATSGTTTTKSKYGVVIETTTSAGTTTNFFDPYGRVFYTEKDGRSVDWIGRNDYGDVEEYDTFHSEGNAYYAEFYGYDSFGNRIVATNALGAVTYSAYDAENRLAESGGAVYPVCNGYDTDGRRTSLTTFRDAGGPGSVPAAGDTTTWTFDPATGFCTVKTYADNSANAYTYTSDGKPLRTTYASGRWRENAYNAKRELALVEYSDGEICTFAYDEFSHEVAASNSVAFVQLLRNDYGQVTNETATVGSESRTVEREFDALGRLTGNDGSTYEYASDGRMASISNALANVEYLYTTDRLDAGYTLTLSNGLVFTRSLMRDAYRRSLVTDITNSVNGIDIETFSYAYDALNRPTSRNADTFGYNDRSEVTSATIGGNYETHEYDSIGNSIIASMNGTTNTYSPNNLNQYTSILRASAPPREPTYDLDGNMLSDGVLSFTYDAANRLKTVSTNGVQLIANFYDAKSRRVKKVTSEATTTFFYDDWNLIEERVAYTNGTTSTIRYYWGKDLSGGLQGAGGVSGLLYLTVSNSSTPNSSTQQLYIPYYDNNGNITRYLDANGNTVAQYTYDAFGNLISKTGPLADFFRHRFSTKYYDAETSLYYYGYRFYHPILMRWLNRDPIEEDGGVNVYCFCENEALIGCDMLGLRWKIVRDGQTFAKAIPCTSEDTFKKLAWEAGLDVSDYKKWAHTNDSSPIIGKVYRIPNVKVYHKGARRFYESWSNNVIGNWDDIDNRHMEVDQKIGFQVILKTNINNTDVLNALSLDGLYEYTFTGHGTGEGSIVTEDADTIYGPDRITLYGIHKLTLQGCDTANDMRTAGSAKYVGWASNVAVAGYFIGYMGESTDLLHLAIK